MPRQSLSAPTAARYRFANMPYVCGVHVLRAGMIKQGCTAFRVITPNSDEEAAMMEDVGMQDVHFNEVRKGFCRTDVLGLCCFLLFDSSDL